MNVTINGYITFRCNSCSNPHTLESKSFKFEEDTSEEAEGDEYIRYLSKINTHCPACSSHIFVGVDVWEHPEAVVNYCYYGERGAHDIQCEFTVEHYFDDQLAEEEDSSYEQLEESDGAGDENGDDEDAKHAPPPIENYMDRYDDDE